MPLNNTIALITKYSTESWDKVYKAESRASYLTPRDGKVQWKDARTIKVAKVSLGGLSDYARNNSVINPGATGLGYAQSELALQWEERTLRQDRAAQYVIEAMDDEETAGIAVASATTEVNRTIVVPEVDAYTFAEIANVVEKAGLGNYVDATIAANTALAEVTKGVTWLTANEVRQDNMLCFISTDFQNALYTTNELWRMLAVTGGPVGKNVSFKVVNYNGIPFIEVPPARFQTKWEKNPGGGYHFGAGSKAIDFILLDRDAALNVVKYQKTKILTGDVALAATGLDGYALYARIYYDCIIFDNKIPGIYVHVGGFTANANAKADFTITLDGNGKITAFWERPAGALTKIYKTTRSLTTANINTKFTYSSGTDTLLSVGDVVGATCVLVGVQGQNIVAVKDLTISGSAPNLTFSLADKDS